MPQRLLTMCMLTLVAPAPVLAITPCKVTVVDKENGWPVPLVQLTTTSHVSLVTDNAGVVALDLPEFMGRETWLTVSSHGYEVPKDGFGYRGVRVTPTPGGEMTIEVERKQIAKRLGRLTGSGIFAESQKLGEHTYREESGVVGSDTVQTASYRGKLFWIWGDTSLPRYPLGIFHTPGAVTDRRPLKRFEPPIDLQYDYFRNDQGQARGLVEMPGKGPTWTSGFVSLPDAKGEEHLVATYAKIPEKLEANEFGLVEWNDETREFDHVLTFWNKSEAEPKPTPPYPDGHPLFWEDADGQRWVYFNGPPNFRCPATYEAWRDRSTWERVDNPRRFSTVEGGEIEVASAAVAWNGYRQRWVMIVQQKFGASPFGEVWYLEGRSPEGPWGPAVKVVTHNNYTFYNVQIDHWLTEPDSPVLLFEGTYTSTFADDPPPTPRWDYNQVLYRLDLDDPALRPAQLEPGVR